MRGLLLPLAALAAMAPAHGRAEDALVFTVRPSAIEMGETLDEKLARRERSFRFICIGCVRAAGSPDSQPFEPIRTLNSPELTAAVAAERAEHVDGAP